MKKYICLLILLFFSAYSFCQSFGLMSTDANSRRTANGQKLRVISKGQEVEILQTKGRYSFVRDMSNDKKGWVSKKLINLIQNIAVLKTDANSRKTANGTKLRVISKGQKVAVLQTKPGWSFVRDLSNGKQGWVANSVLSTNLNSSLNKAVVIKDNKNTPPNCDYKITSPSNGDKNVSIKPTFIRWKHGSGSTKGYYFSISTYKDGEFNFLKTKQNIKIKNLNIGYVTSYSSHKDY